METTVNRAQLEVVAIEVDGELDHIAKLLATYPDLPENVVRQITRATAELIGAVTLLEDAARPMTPEHAAFHEPMGGWEPRT